MPKSRIRRRIMFTPPQERSLTKIESPRWVSVLFVSLMVFGLLWLVAFYVINAADASVPLFDQLGNWNLGVGFAFIGAGFLISTKWR